MEPISLIVAEKATTKRSKIHRDRPTIASKVIAFQELTSSEDCKMSARKATALLNIPNSTLQAWYAQKPSGGLPSVIEQAFADPEGAIFLKKIIMAIHYQAHYGAHGVRGMAQFLQHTGLNHVVASSYGPLYKFNERCEESIIAFGKKEEERLAENMKYKKITVVLDEMFRRRQPCLVAIEAVSNYILLEKFTEDRTAETWKKELDDKLIGLPVEIDQIISDLAGALKSLAETTGAEHSPDLFHGQHEVTKAVGGPLAAKQRKFETGVKDAEEALKKTIEKYGENSKRAKKAKGKLQLQRYGLEPRRARRMAVKAAIQELGKAYHPVDLRTGQLQTAEAVSEKFDKQLKIIEEGAKEAGLASSCLERIEKARRAFDAMVKYMTFFLALLTAYVADLKLTKEQEEFFRTTIFPLAYLKLIYSKSTKEIKCMIKPFIDELEFKLKKVHWPDKLKEDWLRQAKECAERFQRSSSCVEGRNGRLSLYHHCFHWLSARRLKVLTVVQNFHVRRTDETTAANRFFNSVYDDLFEFLVEDVRIPGRPHKKAAEIKKEFVA